MLKTTVSQDVAAPLLLNAARPKDGWTVPRGETIARLALAGLLASLVLAFVRRGAGALHEAISLRTTSEAVFWLLIVTYGGLMYAAFVWRLYLWRRYRPMKAPPAVDLPSLTVVIPCYNEGPLVREAIRSAALNGYPADRLEIIVVDDGSTDDSWFHIQRAAREIGDQARIMTLRRLHNEGKRRALHRAFGMARGDVLATLDSDSVLAPDALSRGVAPLVADPRIGCVAGCVEALNPYESVVTRFLKCTFSLSFKFVRAYQNEFRGVFCAPGALSFYRAAPAHRVADEWLDQRFCGLPCTTGEDRAMTNLFLRDGWLTAYQGNAKVRSLMPTTYAGMCRMFLRWARSNIRETVVLFRFLWTRFRREHLTAFRVNMLLASLSLFLPAILVPSGLAVALTQDGYIMHQVGLILGYAATVCAIYYVNERDGDWPWLCIYEFVWAASLWWIMPYALLTLRNTGWLTRGAGNSDRRAAGAWLAQFQSPCPDRSSPQVYLRVTGGTPAPPEFIAPSSITRFQPSYT